MSNVWYSTNELTFITVSNVQDYVAQNYKKLSVLSALGKTDRLRILELPVWVNLFYSGQAC